LCKRDPIPIRIRNNHNINGTFANDVRDIGAIQKRWVSLRLSLLKDMMFFVDELPNLVDLMEDYDETNSMHYAREELRIAPSVGRFVQRTTE